MRRTRAISLFLLSLSACPSADDAATDSMAEPGSTGTTSTGDDDASTDTTDTSTTTDVPTTGDTTGDATTGDATTGDPALHATCEAAFAGERAFTAWACGCDPEGESDDCRARDPAADICACDLLVADPAHTAALTCNAAAAALLDGCIDDAGCGLDALQNCLNPYWEAAARCEPLPRSAAVELQCRGAGLFTCGSGEPVPDTWKCDGFEDCSDGSDEAACGFVCGDGQVYPFEFECDGEEDCRDGSDERGCP